MDPRAVAKSYLKGWFWFDHVLFISQWVLIHYERTKAGVLVRYLRVMRFIKLCRLIRLESFFCPIAHRPGSISALFLLHIARYIFVLVCYCHLSASDWHALGKFEPSGWVTKHDGFDSFPMNYVGSMRWVVTQMQGNAEVMPCNLMERGLFTCHYIISTIAVTLFISKVTATLQWHHDATADCLLANIIKVSHKYEKLLPHIYIYIYTM